MQNDKAMQKGDDFRPLFGAFIWPALAIEFARTDDAMTKAELLKKSEDELVGEDSDIAKAADAAKAAIEADNDDDDELRDRMRTIVKDSRVDDEDDDENDELVQRARQKAGSHHDYDGNEAADDRGIMSSIQRIFKPVEHLVFSRLVVRGQRTSVVKGSVIGKLMKAATTKPKVCMMANCLGAHILCGILSWPDQLPHRVHTVFSVQGAITRELLEPGAKFGAVKEAVAGPVVCSYSARDVMLKNLHSPFHGKAIGFVGTNVGDHLKMKALHELTDSPYDLANGEWNNVNCTEYIDEENAFGGGHGDFKEDKSCLRHCIGLLSKQS